MTRSQNKIPESSLKYSSKKLSRTYIPFWTPPPPGIFHFFTLSLEIPDKIKLHPWKIHKIIFNTLEIQKPKSKTPWKFHIILSWSHLEIPLSVKGLSERVRMANQSVCLILELLVLFALVFVIPLDEGTD